MNRKIIISSVFIVLGILFYSCVFWNSTDNVILIRKHRYYIELQITKRFMIKGLTFNIHAAKLEIVNEKTAEPEWIYLKYLEPKVEGKDILIETFRPDSAKLKFFESKNEGYISFDFDKSKIQINIKRPRYNNKDEIENHTNYKHNGSYKYIIVKDTLHY